MKILVTGANGLLGQKLCQLLDNDPEIQLTATARKPVAVALKRGASQLLDVTDAEATRTVLQQAAPDVVIHTAAMTQVDQCETDRDACWLNNVTAVENLVHACAGSHSFLIHISTDFIFDGSHGPLNESEKPNPVNFYGKSKLEAEALVMQSHIDWAIVRTVLVYGITADMSRSNIVLWVKKSLEEGKRIQVVNDQWRTPTLAEDLATGCSQVARKKAKGVFHISGEEMMTPYDIAIRTAEFFNLDKSLITATDSNHFKQPAARPLKTGFNIEKAKQELGFQPHSFQDGLRLISEAGKNH